MKSLVVERQEHFTEDTRRLDQPHICSSKASTKTSNHCQQLSHLRALSLKTACEWAQLHKLQVQLCRPAQCDSRQFLKWPSIVIFMFRNSVSAYDSILSKHSWSNALQTCRSTLKRKHDKLSQLATWCVLPPSLSWFTQFVCTAL